MKLYLIAQDRMVVPIEVANMAEAQQLLEARCRADRTIYVLAKPLKMGRAVVPAAAITYEETDL